MHTEVFTALIGLIGIALGALFGGVGYYLKSRVERLRNKKMVLYHLLEFRHQILSSYANPKDFANEYFNICNSYLKKIGLRSEEGIPEVIREAIEVFICKLLVARKPNIDQVFIQSYEESLKNLCGIDPVLAFKLRGMERLHEIINIKEQYIADFNESLRINAPVQIYEFIDRETKQAGYDSTGELLKIIENDVLAVAWSCSFFTWLRCCQIFREKSRSLIDLKQIGIEEALEQLLIKLGVEIEQFNQQNSVGFGASA